MNHQTFSLHFPLGSHLCREPMPAMLELKHDMEILKQHGFNLIKLQENWAIDEPLEGHYDFTRYEELISHAARLDMGIYLGLTCEQAPAWLWRKHPGCRMVGRDGQPITYEAQSTLPADGKPGPCYDHPGAMSDQLRFIQKLVSVLGKYENIVIWNTWQEIGYWGEPLLGQHVCYCENTLNSYRRWLREKYGSLDGLNRAWNTRYGDWGYVSPDRFHGGKNALPQDVDWFYFTENISIANILRTRAQTIRAIDPLKRPIFAHIAGPIPGSGRYWNYARCQDFLGSSCYPAWSPSQAWDDTHPTPGATFDRIGSITAETWNGVALTFDITRSANRRNTPVWAAEFQGGPVSTGFQKGRIPSPEDIRRWMLTAVASGVNGISFWVTRAEIMAAEMNGFSLLDSDGDTTPRLEEATRIGRALDTNVDLFGQPSWPGAPVAILVNEWNHQFCSSMTEGGENLAYSTRGWHRLLWDAGIPVDFVETSELDEPYLNQYRAIILPFPISSSDDTAAKLSYYVDRGGNLISEAGPGRVNEHGISNRGELSPVMRVLFGVKHKSFTMVREPGSIPRWSPPERTWGEYIDATVLTGKGPLNGIALRANVYIETYEITGNSTPCFMYNNAVAGVVNKVGKSNGSAWLFGTYMGHAGTAYRSEVNQNLVRSLMSQCGVPIPPIGSPLLRKRAIPGKEAWIYTNTSGAEMTAKVDVKGWSQVHDLLGEPLERQGDLIILRVNSLDVRVLILKK